MKKEQILEILQTNGFVLDEEKPLQYGAQLKFTNGSVVNVYDKGTITPQGKDIDLVKSILGLTPGNNNATGPVTVAKPANKSKVFVVYAASSGDSIFN